MLIHDQVRDALKQQVHYVIFLANPTANVYFLLALFGTLGGLYAVYYLVQMVASYYNFGTCSGCIALIGASILIAVVNFAVTFGIVILIGILAPSR